MGGIFSFTTKENITPYRIAEKTKVKSCTLKDAEDLLFEFNKPIIEYNMYQRFYLEDKEIAKDVKLHVYKEVVDYIKFNLDDE